MYNQRRYVTSNYEMISRSPRLRSSSRSCYLPSFIRVSPEPPRVPHSLTDSSKLLSELLFMASQHCSFSTASGPSLTCGGGGRLCLLQDCPARRPAARGGCATHSGSPTTWPGTAARPSVPSAACYSHPKRSCAAICTIDIA